MRWAALRRHLASASIMGGVAASLLSSSTPLRASAATATLACESGVLDDGEAGFNVLVFRLCPDRLTIGFESSDIMEEVSCMPDGDVRLWLRVGNARCNLLPASDRDQVHELWEPLDGIGRSTAEPVRQLLICRSGTTNEATTIIVPDARDALPETRMGATMYERVTRRLISACAQPNA
ncbi:MAG: hypothetical protein KIS73_06705 [Enhydrobacter sp.]|nr:hypothetical protein [Enhydrobacter sp.]